MTEQTSNQSSGTTWFVGASFGHTDDQSARFLEEDIWEFSYIRALADEVLGFTQCGRSGEKVRLPSDLKSARYTWHHLAKALAVNGC